MDSFSRNGFRFPVLDTGPAQGPIVVLLHGFPQDASSFDRVVPTLHAEGFRTLVPLQRGYAPTARPAGRRSYRLGALVEDVVALLDAAGAARVHLVGHDWGGIVAWALADRHADRLHTLTALSVPHPSAFAGALVRSAQAVMSSYIAFFQLPVVPEVVLRRRMEGLLTASGLPAADAARYTRTMVGGALTGALNWYRALPFAPHPGFGRVSVPTTYVWGEKDPALGRVAALRTAAQVSAPYRFVQLAAGHWLPETRPVEVARAILDGTTAQPPA